MCPDDMDSDAGAEVDARSYDLMLEFEQHFQQVIGVEPDRENQRDLVFHGWAIQKIAGLQLSVEEIADKFNTHIGGKDHLN